MDKTKAAERLREMQAEMYVIAGQLRGIYDFAAVDVEDGADGVGELARRLED